MLGLGKKDHFEADIEDPEDLMFKIIIEKAMPEGVRISKRNVCIVTITQSDEEEIEVEGDMLLKYFLSAKEPNWAQ